MTEKYAYIFNDLIGRRNYQRYGEAEKRKQRLAGQLFTISVLVSAIYYFVWCINNTVWQYWYMAVPFLVTEFIFLILFLLWANVLWNKRFHRPEGPPLEKRNYSVDVFITVCGEPIDVVKNTLAAARSIHYSNKNIYILDDGQEKGIEKLCAENKIHYLCRPAPHKNRKAGNLNYGLASTNGELILTIDADQVAQPEIIDRIIGYFSISKIAFVQTKQDFILPEGDPWGNADKVFYEVMQPGKDYDNATISCGNGVMYRRSALESIGGFSIWNFVEDMHSSLLMHDKGWRSVYHSESYTTGTAPADVVGHVKQRWQWAVDSLRIFFWDNPFLKRGLNNYQRLQYIHFGYHYFAFGLFLPVFFILPIWALFAHKFMLQEPFWRYLIVRFPYFFLYLISNKITTEKLHNFKIFQAQAGLFTVYFKAVFTALRCKHKLPQYIVTEKANQKSSSLRLRLWNCLPHLCFVICSLVAIIYGLVTIKDDFWFLMVNIFWASWTIAVLWRFVALSLLPRYFIR